MPMFHPRHVLILLLPLALLLTGCRDTRTVMPFSSVPETGDPVRGQELFNTSISLMPTCESCHNDSATASPTLNGYAEVAGSRVEGQNAREYTFYAIAEPAQFIVEGYGNAMYDQYDEKLTPQDMADLIAYLLTR